MLQPEHVVTQSKVSYKYDDIILDSLNDSQKNDIISQVQSKYVTQLNIDPSNISVTLESGTIIVYVNVTLSGSIDDNKSVIEDMSNYTDDAVTEILDIIKEVSGNDSVTTDYTYSGMETNIFTLGTSFNGTNGSYVEDGNTRIFTFNSNNSIALYYSNIQNVNVLTVGGGGSGGGKSISDYNAGGGGGGGEVKSTDIDINLGTLYEVIIGAGGARVGESTNDYVNGNNGEITSVMGISSKGGEGGKYGYDTTPLKYGYGGAGGAGGAGDGYTGNGGAGGTYYASTGPGASYSGAFGTLVNGVYYGGGGGGGSHGKEQDGDGGFAPDINGNCFGQGGYGGEGGGGSGGSSNPPQCRTNEPISASDSFNGTPNSGGGGSGQNAVDARVSTNYVSDYSGDGGSGLVIITVYLKSTEPEPDPEPEPPSPEPLPPPPISNRPGPIQFCNSRFAKCNINKKLGAAFQSGNVSIQGTTIPRRISEAIRVQTYLKNANFVIQDVSLNVYGQRSGGPYGYGSSPKNTF